MKSKRKKSLSLSALEKKLKQSATCSGCGLEFKPPPEVSVCRCPDCGKKNDVRIRVYISKPVMSKCVKCGRGFASPGKPAKYCSPECKRGYRGGEFDNCAYCKKQIWVMQSRAKSKNRFCCHEHSVLHQKEKAFRLNCLVCNEVFYTQPAQVKYRNRKTCSKKCQSAYTRAKWQKIREEKADEIVANRMARRSVQMQEWRVAVFERDDYTCQHCGKRGGKLEADHIKRFADYPELRFDISNGRTLCRPCHQKTDTWGTKRNRAYKNKNIGLS